MVVWRSLPHLIFQSITPFRSRLFGIIKPGVDGARHVAMEINIYISIWAMFLETLYLQACSSFTVLQPPLKMVFDICQWYIFYSECKNWFAVITSKWITCMYAVALGDGWNVKAIFLVCHIGANIPDKMKIPLDFTFLTWGFTIPIVQVVVRRPVQTQQIK